MVRTYLGALRLFSRNARLYLVSAALLGFCWIGIYAVLYNLYLLRLGYGPEFIGLVNAVGMLSDAIFSLLAGALGGRWGIRRAMVLGLSLCVVGLGLPSLTESLPAVLRDAWLLMAISVVWLGAALYIVNGDVFLMGATSPQERGHVLSMQYALWPVGGFLGSFVGGLLPGFFSAALGVPEASPAPYRYALLVAAVLFVPGVPALLATHDVAAVVTKKQVSTARAAPWGLIGFLVVVQLLHGAGDGAARTFFNVYLGAGLGVATSQIGTLAGVAQLLAVPAAMATPLLIARWGVSRTFAGSSLACALCLLPLALVPHWGAAGLGYAGVIALGSVWRPSFVMCKLGVVPPRWRALMNGATNMATGLSWSAMALGGGHIATGLGYPSLFLIGAAATAAGALLFWAYFRVERGEFAGAPTKDGARRAR